MEPEPSPKRQKTQANKAAHTHTGDKPFACSECQMGFSRKDSLNRHRRTHTEDKLHVCPECQMGFSRKDSLNRHRRTHTEAYQAKKAKKKEAKKAAMKNATTAEKRQLYLNELAAAMARRLREGDSAPEEYKTVYGNSFERDDDYKLPLPVVLPATGEVLAQRGPRGSTFLATAKKRIEQVINRRGKHTPAHGVPVDAKTTAAYNKQPRSAQDKRLRGGDFTEMPKIEQALTSLEFVNLDTYFSADLTKKIQAALKVLKEYDCEDFPTTVSPLLESTHKCLSQLKSIRFFVNPFSLVAAHQLTEAQHKVFNAAEKKWLTKQIEKSDKDAAGRIKTTHIVVSACTGSASNQLFNGVLAFPGWAQRIQLKEPVYVDAVEGKVYNANGKEIKGRDKGSS